MATAKVTGQMEAILPEAAESSCDQGLLCHSRQDLVCGRAREERRGKGSFSVSAVGI